MTTTAIFVELVAAGVLALAALVLTALGLSTDWLSILWSANAGPDPGRAKEFLMLLAFALIYPLGVLVDSWADQLFGNVGMRYKQKFNLEDHNSLVGLVLREPSKRPDVFLLKFLEYTRVRMRLMRSFLLNVILLSIALAGCAFRFRNHDQEILIAILLLVCLFVIAWRVLDDLQKTWFKNLAFAWDTWPERPITSCRRCTCHPSRCACSGVDIEGTG